MALRLLDGRGHPADRVHRLAADVDERLCCAHRVAGDDDALDHRVRVVHHQRQVTAGARLALVGVDHDVVRLRGLAGLACGMNCHFMPVGKPAPPRPRRFESLTIVMSVVRRQRQRLAQAGVAVEALVVVDLPRLVGAEPLGQDGGERHLLLRLGARLGRMLGVGFGGLERRVVRTRPLGATAGGCAAVLPLSRCVPGVGGVGRRGLAAFEGELARRSRSGRRCRWPRARA